MAVKSTTYGSVAGVEALVGDLVDSRTFSTSTVPTIAQVESFLDQIGGELNSTLTTADYVVPVVTGDDPYSFDHLVALNNAGGAVMVLQMLPAEAGISINDNEQSNGRIRGYNAFYMRGLKRIEAGQLAATKAALSQTFVAGSRENADGDINKELFRRGIHGYPALLELTE